MFPKVSKSFLQAKFAVAQVGFCRVAYSEALRGDHHETILMPASMLLLPNH